MRPMVVPSIYSNCAASHHDGCIFIPFCSLFLCLVLHLFPHLSIIFTNLCAQVCVVLCTCDRFHVDCKRMLVSCHFELNNNNGNWYADRVQRCGLTLWACGFQVKEVQFAMCFVWKKHICVVFYWKSDFFFVEKAFFYVKEAHFRSEKIESILLSTEKCSISIKKWIRIPIKTENK